ncbi:hypothetical protein L226DRAFT_528198 [Lentinus tigrinus ALCF2SS1-7]|uniref:uncharacterized protein n=1 Tax=Lentinus tigrinus ALCF2SS1-7 TaxID=1328758 RepID=UPI001166397F|nr:hypothetical protein L226DRAFT_528198 [Lentinus tigrinus ALCF2SS1-7]
MNNDGQQQQQQPPQSASSAATSFRSHSVRSSTRAPPSTIKTYINTAPPWARDEPPSPNENEPSQSARHLPSPHRPSDAASFQSSAPDDPGPSRWWTFARHRPTDSGSIPLSPSSPRPTRRPRDGSRSMSIPWLTASVLRRSQEQQEEEDGEGSPSSQHTATARETDPDGSDHGAPPRLSNRSRLRIDMPPTNAPFTLAQTRTPGWDTPWTSAHPNGTGSIVQSTREQGSHHDDEKLTPWQRRRKRLRAYMLYNIYVPLLFRLCNIVLTTAALGIAIKIRLIESRNGVMGALGSSPTLVIIFGSLTLVHVMIAIYLEYFGRPLGLWHTSWKLAYTLFEVVFICTWAAALALSFDNFFTSLIPCASASSISWYSQLPRPALPNGINGFEGGVGDTLCDDQLALICLVGVGLLMYCFNIFIALFRIFEKVKYHPAAMITA